MLKRILSVTAVAAFAVAGLAACGEKSPGDAAGDAGKDATKAADGAKKEADKAADGAKK